MATQIWIEPVKRPDGRKHYTTERGLLLTVCPRSGRICDAGEIRGWPSYRDSWFQHAKSRAAPAGAGRAVVMRAPRWSSTVYGGRIVCTCPRHDEEVAIGDRLSSKTCASWERAPTLAPISEDCSRLPQCGLFSASTKALEISRGWGCDQDGTSPLRNYKAPANGAQCETVIIKVQTDRNRE